MTAVVAVGEVALVATTVALLVRMTLPRKTLVPVRADRANRGRGSRRR